MRFCSANSQSLHRLTSALQANNMQRSMKLEIMSRDGINTNSSWEHNSHSPPMQPHQIQTNARMTRDNTYQQRKVSGTSSHCNRKGDKFAHLIAEQENGNLIRTTQLIRCLWNSGHNAHRPNPHERNQVITLNWFDRFVDIRATQPSRLVQAQKHKDHCLPKDLVPKPKPR